MAKKTELPAASRLVKAKFEIFGMAILRKEDSSLPVDMFYGPAPDNKKVPRVKIAYSPKALRSKSGSLSLSIATHPEVLAGDPGEFKSDLQLIMLWISRNQSVLLKFWYGAIKASAAERLLEAEADESPSYDELVIRMRFLWETGTKKDEIATQVRIPKDAVDLIIDTNTKLFKKRK
jgi:hypothetical protein